VDFHRKSYLWRTLSVNAGDPRASKTLEETAQEMTVGQIEKAKSLLANWKPNPAECVAEAVPVVN
jgi:hypothetical protein